MSQQWFSRSTIEAPFLPKEGIAGLGRSVWLYLHLLRIANLRGLALRTVERLGEELVLPKDTIEEWLRRLSRAKLVHLEAPPPFLVIKLPFWSGNDDAQRVDFGSASGSSSSGALEVPVGSKQLPAAAAFNHAGEGGAGEGEALVAEVARVLDGADADADADEIRALITEFPKPVVLKALIRVKTTPSSQIRKSKSALFRYLLAKFVSNPRAH